MDADIWVGNKLGLAPGASRNVVCRFNMAVDFVMLDFEIWRRSRVCIHTSICDSETELVPVDRLERSRRESHYDIRAERIMKSRKNIETS